MFPSAQSASCTFPSSLKKTFPGFRFPCATRRACIAANDFAISRINAHVPSPGCSSSECCRLRTFHFGSSSPPSASANIGTIQQAGLPSKSPASTCTTPSGQPPASSLEIAFETTVRFSADSSKTFTATTLPSSSFAASTRPLSPLPISPRSSKPFIFGGFIPRPLH